MPVPCTECEKIFSVATNMYRHRRSAHGLRRPTPPTLENKPLVHTSPPALQSDKIPPLVEDLDVDDTDESSQLCKYK